MMRNTGSSMQYMCIYAAVCVMTSLLALYGTMEHARRGSSPKPRPSHDNEAEAIQGPVRDATRHRQQREDMDIRLRAVDAKMQLVLANASHELTNFGHRVTDWDNVRRENQKVRPAAAVELPNSKILLVSSSHSHECENAHGDNILLKSLKNKVDYCRLHGLELYHNMDILDEKMVDWWVKVFVIHMLMLARPDVEWILWMDSDAVFTNMTFELPLEKYKDYNMVLQGWDSILYMQKSWLGLNTGVILLRNCQWSIDLLHEWARFSPKGHVREAAGVLLTEALPERPLTDAEDQCSLVYLLLTQRSQWGPKVYLENAYHLQGFFEIMTMTNKYPGMGETWWPVITHFTGCQICSGKPNSQYDVASCHKHMERAFKVANNQVLQLCGYTYVSLQNSVVKHV